MRELGSFDLVPHPADHAVREQGVGSRSIFVSKITQTGNPPLFPLRGITQWGTEDQKKYQRTDSNRHAPFGARDFKSLVSTIPPRWREINGKS